MLGGKITPIINASHFMVSEDKVGEFSNNENIKLLQKKIIVVNVRWLFHCYFFYKRMDEEDEEYRIRF